jgi:hypothetical protein
VGNQSIQYSPDFRIYVTTREENPNFPQHVAMWFNLVDFSMTCPGLNTLLRNALLKHKAPRLYDALMGSLLAHVEKVGLCACACPTRATQHSRMHVYACTSPLPALQQLAA